jgi:hypothetical protein
MCPLEILIFTPHSFQEYIGKLTILLKFFIHSTSVKQNVTWMFSVHYSK